jgi:hypothetical protein
MESARGNPDESSEGQRGAQVERFNLETMSGVYPGTRTQVWQRIQLVSRESAIHARQSAWALIYWYDEPPAAVVTLQEGSERQAIRLEGVATGNVQSPLDGALETAGYGAFVCGRCGHWQDGAGVTVDGLALGACQLRRDDELPLLLSGQSTLALGCVHWEERSETGESAQAGMFHTLPPLPKIAEVSESKMKPLRRWRVRVRRWLSPPAEVPDLAARLIERSGVGAGTEPCPCCQGRIANLGALAVESQSGDKETLSVWRCRFCHVLLLSDWIDRWERADSLETEETIFRIAPVEAAEILTLIASVTGGEHPRRRAERTSERDWIHAQVLDRDPISHLVKQGR